MHANHSWFNTNANIGTGFYYTSTSIMGIVPFPVPLRTQPTLYSSSGTNYFAIQREGTTDGFNDFTLSTTSYNTAKITQSSNVGGVAGVCGQLQTETNGYLGFSAELWQCMN